MILDLTDAVALLGAYLDDDEQACFAISRAADPGDLVQALVWLALQLGRHAYGSDEALRDALRDALTCDPSQRRDPT